MSDIKPEPNNDVTSASGYTVEGKTLERVANGWGGSQTKLRRGHLARRDAKPVVKATDR